MDGIESLREKANARRAEITAIRVKLESYARQMEFLSAQADAYDDAVQIMSAARNNANAPESSNGASHEAAAPESSVADEATGDKRRGPKGPWKDIFAALYKAHPGEFVLDDVWMVGASVGHEINRNTLRSQMSNYAKFGWVERVKEGRYRFSRQGIDIVTELQNAAGRKGSGRDAPAADDVYAAGGSPGDFATDPKASADHPNSPGESDPG